MAKACEECTQNCHMMHKRKKVPAPVVTTFFKVMIGEDYSKLLLLPPVFARRVKNLVDKTTHLEDYNGEKWNVKFTKNDNGLAFEEGWNDFASAHGLQQGDMLVFHYIMKSHFVVLMYGSTGCPENRHFGFPIKEKKKKNNNLIPNRQSPSEVLTNCNNFSHESTSKSEPCNKNLTETKMSQSEKTTNAQHLVVASSSQPLDEETDQIPEPLVQNTDKETDQIPEPLVKNKEKETDQRSEPLVENTTSDLMVSKSPTTVKPSCLVDNSNVHEPDDCGRKCLQPVVEESDSYQKNNVAVCVEDVRKRLETRMQKRKESIVGQSEVPDTSTMHKRPRTDDDLCTPEKIVQKEPDTLASRLHNSGYHFTANRVGPIKKEPTMNHDSDGLLKKEPTMNHGSCGLLKKEPSMNPGSSGPIKMEPADYDEAPLLSGSSNTSFSAVMSSYQYLQLPEWVKLKSRVILLRNGNDLWAVLYQFKYGLKALTQNWGTFAKEKGIKPGDKCEFVLESEPNNHFTCNVFNVHISR